MTYRLRHLESGREASFNVDQIVPVKADNSEDASAENKGNSSSSEVAVDHEVVDSTNSNAEEFETYDPADSESSDDDSDLDATYQDSGANPYRRYRHTD